MFEVISRHIKERRLLIAEQDRDVPAHVRVGRPEMERLSHVPQQIDEIFHTVGVGELDPIRPSLTISKTLS